MRVYLRFRTTRFIASRAKIIIWLICLLRVVPATAETIFVANESDPLKNGVALRAALLNARCGDEIVLAAGAAYYGNFVLPHKGACSGTDADYITIRTSDLAGIPPAGTRITPAHASAMPKLVANSTYPALEAEANAHHYRLIGVEITNVGGSMVTQALVNIGGRSSGDGIPYSQHPHHIIFDRTWVHEATNDTTTPNGIVTTAIRGFAINAADIVITESRIAGFRTYQPVSQGVEASNAIVFVNSARRVTVQNTYLEAWFVPVFFGGSSGETANTATLSNAAFDRTSNTGSAMFSSVSNLAVGDLVAFKTTGGRTPPTNYSHPSELVQFQVAKVVSINGNNVNFRSWGSLDGDLAGGNPLLQVPDSPGLAQWNGYLNEDIRLIGNQFVENFASTELVWTSTGGSPTTQPRSTQTNVGSAPKGMIEIKMAKNLLIDGNTFEGWAVGFTVTSRNQGNIHTSGGFPWSGLFNITISNNWWKRSQNWDRIYSYPIGGPLLQDTEYSSVRSGPFAFINNLVEMGAGPILAAMGSADNVTVAHNTYPGAASGDSMVFGVVAASPNFELTDNILPNNEYGLNCQSPTPCWPGLVQAHNVIIDNRTPASKSGDGPLDSKYPNDFIAASQAAIGWTDPASGNYALAENSPYKRKASDGKDPGVDMSLLISALNRTARKPAVTITSPASGETVSGTVTVTAECSADINATQMEFYVDGIFHSVTRTSPFRATVDPQTLGEGTHSLVARVFDASGLAGISDPVFFIVKNADVTLPAVTVTSPIDGAQVSGQLTIVASATDNSGVSKVEFLVDSILISTSTASPFTITIDTKTVSNGTHLVSARAYDSAGNSATSGAITVTVFNDTPPLQTMITSPSDGVIVSGAITVTGATSDDAEVSQVEFLADDIVFGVSTTSPHSQFLDTTRLSNTSHSLKTRTYDKVGNSATSAPVTIYVNNLPKDTTRPSVTIRATMDSKGVVSVSATATDDIGIKRVEFYVDGKLNATDGAAPYNTSFRLTGRSGSQHTLVAKVYDAAGNVGVSESVILVKR